MNNPHHATDIKFDVHIELLTKPATNLLYKRTHYSLLEHVLEQLLDADLAKLDCILDRLDRKLVIFDPIDPVDPVLASLERKLDNLDQDLARLDLPLDPSTGSNQS